MTTHIILSFTSPLLLCFFFLTDEGSKKLRHESYTIMNVRCLFGFHSSKEYTDSCDTDLIQIYIIFSTMLVLCAQQFSLKKNL